MLPDFFGRRRAAQLEEQLCSLKSDNRGLRARLQCVELELTRRRADAVAGARLSRAPNAPHLDGPIAVAVDGLLAVADDLENSSSREAVGRDIRARTDAIVASLRHASEPQPGELDRREEYADIVRGTWDAVDRNGVARNITTRIAALDPRFSSVTRLAPGHVVEVAAPTISALLDDGPVAAALALRAVDGIDLDGDTYALGAEATLYALALALGGRWTDATREAWCLAIDDVALALGFKKNETTEFSCGDSLLESLG